VTTENFILAHGDRHHSLFISNPQYWSDHELEINEWIETVLGGRVVHMGMVLQFKTTQDLMMFLLKWS
jgi:hypothetical protein